jgi:hypothetical protein
MKYYNRYQQGEYREVSDELLALGGAIYGEPRLYDEAFRVMRALMKRVRSNIEVLLSRLPSLGYIFRTGGFWRNSSVEERTMLEQAYPVFQLREVETQQQIVQLERLVGPLPLSLKCWYEEVGTVNLVEMFLGTNLSDSCTLDPLWVNPLAVMLQMVNALTDQGTDMNGWQEEPFLIIAPDAYHKYGYSGGGAYSLRLPSRSIDTLLVDESHQTTFVHYLRICFRWGGLPGLETLWQAPRCPLTQDELNFLTRDLLPF